MERSTRAASEIHRVNTFFPLLPRLGERWARTRPWEGRCVALNAHLTTLSGALVRELTLGGGEWVVCAANEATTDPDVVALLRELGVTVHTGADLHDRHVETLDAHPDLVADLGFELLDTLLDRRPEQAREVSAAVVMTATGVARMRRRGALPFPVLNLNEGALKPSIENRRGVGEAFWSAVRGLTGIHMSGRHVLVLGYGPVGQGLAHDARAAGAVVDVVELDPIRRLVAHYDGFGTPDLREGIARAEVVVTATGRKGALPLEALEEVRGGLVLANAGHGGDEFDVPALRARAEEVVEIGPDCHLYRIGGGRHVAVLGGGHPLNIVLNSGSPEPVLLHFAVLGLTLEWLARGEGDLPPGEVALPRHLEEEAARGALASLAGRR